MESHRADRYYVVRSLVLLVRQVDGQGVPGQILLLTTSVVDNSDVVAGRVVDSEVADVVPHPLPRANLPATHGRATLMYGTAVVFHGPC